LTNARLFVGFEDDFVLERVEILGTAALIFDVTRSPFGGEFSFASSPRGRLFFVGARFSEEFNEGI
jgi:hypothetical protein